LVAIAAGIAALLDVSRQGQSEGVAAITIAIAAIGIVGAAAAILRNS